MSLWSPDGPPIDEGYEASWETGEGPALPNWEAGWGNIFPGTAVDEIVFEDSALVRSKAAIIDSVVFEDAVSAWITRLPKGAVDEFVVEDSVSAYISRLPRTFADEFVVEDSVSAAFTAMPPATTTFTSVGSFTYTIPPWCKYIDIIALGGGKGGQTGSGAINQAGSGGLPGQWAVATLQRGADIPWSEAQLTGIVGAGGAGGANSDNAPGGNGTASTVTASAGTLSAAGGTGTNSGRDGPGPGNYIYLGTEYVGGATAVNNGQAGNPPGGGGAGGNGGIFGIRTRGGAGARGQVWIRAYQ
ncbi:hypothetical protein SEA_STICKER17_30 [Gordonia phage Sticker17]|nr:hypothetical protein SEA_STICKER17_30 [Gordonia phage Sticker17]